MRKTNEEAGYRCKWAEIEDNLSYDFQNWIWGNKIWRENYTIQTGGDQDLTLATEQKEGDRMHFQEAAKFSNHLTNKRQQ